MTDDDSPLASDLSIVIRAGAAVYNAGEHHAAHDAWEATWLDLESGTDDERLLHGLIQFTAAVYHARNRNWSGATGLAESTDEYLDGLGASPHGVDLDGVRDWLRALRSDPERIERASPPPLLVDGEAIVPAVLTLDEVAVAATVVAEEYDFDEDVVADAVRFARGDDDPDGTTETTFLRDFVADSTHRPVIYERLSGLVERRRREEEDVEGLFDRREE